VTVVAAIARFSQNNPGRTESVRALRAPRESGTMGEMGKGYAEGPAAEEAERRRAELAEQGADATGPTRRVVVGCTAARPERHVLGWADELDLDALFASGEAWGLRVERRADPT
jgi:hypothetical protein